MTEDPFRVVFVTKSDLSGRSGHNIITRNIALAFAGIDGVETTVVSPRPVEGTLEAVSEQASETVYISQRPSDLSITDRFRSVLSTFRTLRSVLREEDPDLLVARMAPDLLAPPFLAERYGVPYALLARGTAYKELRFSSVLTNIYQYNLRKAHGVYTASEEIKEDADDLRREEQAESTILPNAVDPSQFSPRPIESARNELDIDLEGFVVGFLGTMRPYHKIEVLVQSLPHVKQDDVHLLLIGDGPELERYQSIARDLGVADRVHCTGFVPHSQVDGYLSACDVLYAVRSQASATPVKIYEYLACERPVLIREMNELSFVNELDVGRTVAKPDPKLVASAIDELHKLDSETRMKMGRRGRDHVERECTWDAFVRRVIDDFR